MEVYCILPADLRTFTNTGAALPVPHVLPLGQKHTETRVAPYYLLQILLIVIYAEPEQQPFVYIRF